jgi:acyl-coenzyme A thioesterase PaaI-like protein
MASLRQRLLMRLVSLYPPYLGAGVRVAYPKDDAHRITVRMGLHWWNKNLFGTQFGGSLYAMCDPHFVFLVMRQLGPGYLVWDKAAGIEFLKPGRGGVSATFVVTPGKIAEIRAAADCGEKVEPVFTAEVVAEEDGEVVARVTKRLWVRKKAPETRDIARAGPFVDGGGAP